MKNENMQYIYKFTHKTISVENAKETIKLVAVE